MSGLIRFLSLGVFGLLVGLSPGIAFAVPTCPFLGSGCDGDGDGMTCDADDGGVYVQASQGQYDAGGGNGCVCQVGLARPSGVCKPHKGPEK
jgi:hypothetical protein